MNNYYDTIENCEILLQNKIKACGTIRKKEDYSNLCKIWICHFA